MGKRMIEKMARTRRVRKPESDHRLLVKKGAYWLNKQASNIKYRSQFVVTEFVFQGGWEVPDIFGLRPYGHILIEVKTSRADFFRDQKKKCRRTDYLQIGNFRFYLTPQNLIKLEELPERWGLLEWDGKKVRLMVDADFVETDTQTIHYLYHSILRRLHKPQVFDFRPHVTRGMLQKTNKL